MVLFTLENPQVTTSTVFIYYIASVALIRPKITRKLIHNGRNQAVNQNKEEIIYLNEYFIGQFCGEKWVLVSK